VVSVARGAERGKRKQARRSVYFFFLNPGPHPFSPPSLHSHQDGVHYHFVSHADFEAGVTAGAFLEHASVHGNRYGTTRAAVEAVGAAGKCCVLDIDVQGARAVRAGSRLPGGLRAVFLFVAPPGLDTLAARLAGRGTENPDQVATRLAAAAGELASLGEPGLYDFVILNDDVGVAAAQLAGVGRRALEGGVGNGVNSATGDAGGPLDPGAPLPLEDACEAAAAGLSPLTTAAAGPSSPLRPVVAGGGRLAGRIALVTGASSGIGRAAVVALATEGARVAGVARRGERLTALAADLIARHGLPPDAFLGITADVTEPAQVALLPALIHARWGGGGPDTLVNAAGASHADSALLDGDPAAWAGMASLNILAPANLTRAVLAALSPGWEDASGKGGRPGTIIHVGSLMGHRVYQPSPGVGGFYAATKHALRAMADGLRLEITAKRYPCRVAVVSPGRVATEFFEAVQASGRAKLHPLALAPAPGKPALTAEDVAAAILFVAAAPPHVDVNDVLVRPLHQAM